MTVKSPVELALEEAKIAHVDALIADRKLKEARQNTRAAEAAEAAAERAQHAARVTSTAALAAVNETWLKEEIRAVPDMVLLGISKWPAGFGGTLAVFLWPGPTPGAGRLLGRQYRSATIGLGEFVEPTWDTSDLIRWRVFAQARHAGELRALMAHAELILAGAFKNIWDPEIAYGRPLAPDNSTLYRLVAGPVSEAGEREEGTP